MWHGTQKSSVGPGDDPTAAGLNVEMGVSFKIGRGGVAAAAVAVAVASIAAAGVPLEATIAFASGMRGRCLHHRDAMRLAIKCAGTVTSRTARCQVMMTMVATAGPLDVHPQAAGRDMRRELQPRAARRMSQVGVAAVGTTRTAGGPNDVPMGRPVTTRRGELGAPQ